MYYACKGSFKVYSSYIGYFNNMPKKSVYIHEKPFNKIAYFIL